jgi:hypothetical protein
MDDDLMETGKRMTRNADTDRAEIREARSVAAAK